MVPGHGSADASATCSSLWSAIDGETEHLENRWFDAALLPRNLASLGDPRFRNLIGTFNDQAEGWSNYV